MISFDYPEIANYFGELQKINWAERSEGLPAFSEPKLLMSATDSSDSNLKHIVTAPVLPEQFVTGNGKGVEYKTIFLTNVPSNTQPYISGEVTSSFAKLRIHNISDFADLNKPIVLTGRLNLVTNDSREVDCNINIPLVTFTNNYLGQRFVNLNTDISVLGSIGSYEFKKPGVVKVSMSSIMEDTKLAGVELDLKYYEIGYSTDGKEIVLNKKSLNGGLTRFKGTDLSNATVEQDSAYALCLSYWSKTLDN